MNVENKDEEKKEEVKLTSQKDGLLVIIKALQLAQSRGAFSMEESSMIHQAVELFRGDK